MKASQRRRLFVELIFGAFAIAVCWLPATIAHAQSSYYWDSNGTAAGAGDTPNGFWGSSAYWSTSSSGTATPTLHTTTSADSLFFVAGPSSTSGTNSFTVTVSGTQNASGISFQSSGGPTLSGTGAINLWGGGIYVPQYAYSNGLGGGVQQGSVNISVPVALQASQTWTNVGGNGLYNNVSLTIAGSVANGGNTLTIAGYGPTTISGAISGSGGLTKNDPGTLTLTAPNIFTGATRISGGVLQLGDGTNGDDGWLASASIINNASLVYNLYASENYWGSISGSGNVTKNGGGTLTLSGTNTYWGGTTVGGGVLAVTSPGALPAYFNYAYLTVNSGTLAVSAGGSGWTDSNINTLLSTNGSQFASGSFFGIDTTGATSGFPYSYTIAGSMGLAKLGPNTLTLSATNNTYTGGTTVNLGTLALTNTGALPSYSSTACNLAVNNGAMLTLSVSGSGWTAANVNSLLGANGGGFASGSFLGIDTTNASFTYSNSIGGGMGLAKVGSNVLVLTTSNSYTGPTSITAGTLQLGTGAGGNDGSVPAAGGINDNGVLAYNLAGSQTYAGVISGAGILTKAGSSGVLTLTGSNSYSGGTTITGGTLQLGDGTSGHDGSLSSTINNSAALVYNLYGPQTYSGTISGTGVLTKIGPGTLNLNGSNSYSGTTTVNGGALVVTSTAALPYYNTSTKVAVGSGAMLTLSVGGAGWTASNVSSLIGSNSGGFGSGSALGIDTTLAGTSGFYYGYGNNSIAGSMGLTVMGPYSLILTGSNGYTGGTTIAGGALQFGNGSGGYDGSITGPITDNSWLVFDLASSRTFSGAISGSGGLAKYGSNTLVLTGSNTFSSATYVNAGTLTLANSAALQGSIYSGGGGALVFSSSVGGHAFTFGGLSGSNNLSLQDNAGNPVALSVNSSVSSVYSGALSGSGNLTKTGSNGSLTLIGANSYTGGTTITGGTLQLGDGSSGHDGSLASAGGLTDNAALVYDLYGSQTYGGSISGTGGLTKAGGGLLSLTGANSSFSGAATITGGTLQLGDGSLFNSIGITDNAALVCNINGSQTYAGNINGTGGLTKSGSGALTLSNSNIFSGTTTISGGTLNLAQNGALQGSTVIAPTAGSIVFANSGAYTFGGLSGLGNLSLQTSGGTPVAVALTVGNNNASTTYSGALGGSGSLVKAGNGTLTFTGSNTCNGGVTLGSGGLTLVSTASLTITPSSGNLYIGNTGPAAMTIQDDAVAKVGGELDVNFQSTGKGPSTLTLTGGSLHVTGPTYIGRASMLTDPTTVSAAVNQSGGTATLAGQTLVGYRGTAASLYDINGGVLNANGGLSVGVQGNGAMNIQGSGVVNVSGGAGLVIGQDFTDATSGSVNLSSGALSVTGNVTFGVSTTQGSGGIGLLSRSGGAMSVTGNLVVDGNATVLLDGTTGSVATIFGGGLSRTSPGTMVVVPQTGNLSTSEAVYFTNNPSTILGPWAVVQASGTNTAGDYLTTTATTLGGHAYYQLTTLSGSNYDLNFSQSGNTVFENATAATTLTSNWTVDAIKTSGTTTLTGHTLTVYSGGMILNGGIMSGGSVSFNSGVGSTPLIYAGTSIPGTINSAIESSLGLVKFGPGTLVLGADNSTTLSGPVLVSAGTLLAQNSGALGAGGPGSPTTVAAGASLALQNNIAISNVPITLNGAGVGGAGALENVQGNNSLGGAISLGGNSEINTLAGTLTLTGPIQNLFSLTKAGSGTLVLAGTSGSAFPTSVTVAGGALRLNNSAAMGPGLGSVTVNSGASLQLQNSISGSAVSLTLNGAGPGGNGALEDLQGNNSFISPITLGSDSQVNIDNASDTLTLSGSILGGFALTKAGPGALVVSGNNAFTGALNIVSGTLSVPSLNNVGVAGPLGEGATPVSLGSNSNAAVFLCASGGSTNRAFTLAGSGGVFPVDSSLTLSGPVGGNGGLTKTGSGTLTVNGSDSYAGPTTITSGTLAVSSSGAIDGTSGINVAQGCALQVTAGGGGGQLSDAGNIALFAATLNYLGNGSASPGETTGALLLNPGQSTVATSNAGSGTTYLCFASGSPSAATGATVNFAGTNNAQIQFQANPPNGNGGIIGGYAFYNNTDFAALTAAGPGGPYTVGACANYTSGDLGTISSSGTVNAMPSGTQTALSGTKEINSLKLSGTAGVNINGWTLTLDSGGLIGNTTGSIVGGTIKGSSSGELVVNTLQNLSVSSIIADNGGPTALVKTGSAVLTLTSPSTFTGNIYLNQGTLAYQLSSNLTYGGVISGVGSLSASGNSVLTLNGMNTYSGSTTVTGGGLVVNGALGSGPVSLQNASLSGSGVIGGGVTLSGGTINFSNGGSIAGPMTASGNCYWLGSGSLGGPFNFSGGTLTISNSAVLTTGGNGLSVPSGAGLNFANSATLNGSLNYASTSGTLGGTIAGNNSSLTLNNSATTLTLSGNNSYGGGTTVAAGTLQVAGNTALGSSTGGLSVGGQGYVNLNGYSETFASLSGTTGGLLTSTAGTATVTVSMSSGISTNYAGSISQTGSHTLALVVSGSGDLTLSGTDTFSGGLTLNGGTLCLATPSALPTSGLVTIGGGGRLVLGGGSGIGALFRASSPSSEATISLSAATNPQVTIAVSDVGGESETVPFAASGQALSPPDPGGGGSANAVPEPGTLALLLAAVFGLVLVLGKKGRRVAP